MADKVYQLKVDGKDITLGKGPDADDAFVSFKELSNFTVAWCKYTWMDGTKLHTCEFCIPWHTSWTNNEGIEIIQTQTTGWPVLAGSYNGHPIYKISYNSFQHWDLMYYDEDNTLQTSTLLVLGSPTITPISMHKEP